MEQKDGEEKILPNGRRFYPAGDFTAGDNGWFLRPERKGSLSCIKR